MIGGSQELQNYVYNARGLGRKQLNIMCLIGLFIFGWLLSVAFDLLGKSNRGWLYFVPLVLFINLSLLADPSLWGVTAFIYMSGWIEANRVLSRYQASARDRIEEIDRLSGDQLTIDPLIEKGILQQKVLGNSEAAESTFVKVLQMPGGNGQLLNLAGVVLFNNKRYIEAKQFFSRALSSVADDALMQQIKQNLTAVEKKLK